MHCLAESPVISRSWTCRDSWRGWRSGVHTITVYPTGEISAGGKSALWPPTLPTHPSTALTPPHTHSSHTLTIGLSISLSLCLRFNPTLADILLHITEKVYTRQRLYSEHSGNVLMSIKKKKKKVCTRLVVLTNITYINVNRCHAVWLFLQCDHADLRLCVFVCFFWRIYRFTLQAQGTFSSLVSRESVSLLAVTERSYTCTLAAVKTSCWCSHKVFREHTHTLSCSNRRNILGTHARTYGHN